MHARRNNPLGVGHQWRHTGLQAAASGQQQPDGAAARALGKDCVQLQDHKPHKSKQLSKLARTYTRLVAKLRAGRKLCVCHHFDSLLQVSGHAGMPASKTRREAGTARRCRGDYRHHAHVNSRVARGLPFWAISNHAQSFSKATATGTSMVYSGCVTATQLTQCMV